MSARFVARHAAYSHGIREEIAEQFSKGTRVIQRGLEAQFDPRGLTDYEKEQAVHLLSFSGLPEDRETERDVSPHRNLGLFDSAKEAKRLRWTEEEEEFVVQTLRESAMLGIEFIEVDAPRRDAPFATYDKLTDVDQILELVLATGADLAGVLAYESENQAREALMAGLEDLLDPSTGEADLTITA